MTNEMVIKENKSIITTYDEVERVAKAMAASGFFPDVKSISQSIVKIMAGSEIGFGAFASMQGVNIIKGRPSYNANMLASSVKASGKYDYRIAKLTDEVCDLIFYEYGKEVGHSIFTAEDARRANVSNMNKFPRNMVFARAMSNGVKWYTPDVTNGNAIYTPEELGAEVDENGDIIDSPSVTISEPEPTESIEQVIEDAGPEDIMTIERACAVTTSKDIKYGNYTAQDLSNISSGIDIALKKPDVTDERKAELEMKLKAIKILLIANANGEFNLPAS